MMRAIQIDVFTLFWTPAIIPTQSRTRCTISVNIIDFVVSADLLSSVVEQVYSNTFKFSLLKYIIIIIIIIRIRNNL